MPAVITLTVGGIAAILLGIRLLVSTDNWRIWQKVTGGTLMYLGSTSLITGFIYMLGCLSQY